MVVAARRAQLAPAYILHHRPYRDTSRILEVLTRDFGKLSLFARGVRGPKARFMAQLQPFQLLLLSWSGRGEAPMLTGAETAGDKLEEAVEDTKDGLEDAGDEIDDKVDVDVD